jgi:4'-phosphopantetheinyl transferase
MRYWTAHDAVTFLLDLGADRPALHDLLTKDERERERRFKPAIARRRFVASRAILKHILSEILQKENPAEIVLARTAEGRVLVEGHPDVSLCLAYHGTSLAVTVGRRKIGSDLEGVRPVRDTKITASPIYHAYPCAPGVDRTQQVIHLWTLVESYAKLYDTNPYPLLSRSSPFGDADFASYCIDHRMILSLTSSGGPVSEVLLWLDLPGTGTDTGSP